MKNFINGVAAEFLKFKGTYVWWLCLLVVSFVSFIMFIGHYLDVNSLARFGSNPWSRISIAGQAIFSLFILGLFVALLTGASSSIENKASGWKLLYSYPRRRSNTFYTKLLSLILVIILLALALTASIYCCGWMLDWARPEYEFKYYSFGVGEFVSSMAHSIISVLGILGIHYFLALFFKNFIIPIGIGVVGFILGLILASMNTSRALFCPYSYPMVVKDFEMFQIDNIGVIDYGWINNVERNSIIIFVVFIVLANIMEARRNVV